MAHPHHHALSSVKRWGGQVSDYMALHDFFDASKAHCADFRHRSLRHHSLGVYQLEEMFGKTITLSTGRVIPTRWVGEQHVTEDLGFIPTWADWCRAIQPQRWMTRSKKLSLELDPEQPASSDRATPDEAPPAHVSDVALERANAILTAYADLSLSPKDDSDETIAAVIADLLHLAATKGAKQADVTNIIHLAREQLRAEHEASSAAA